MVVVRSRSVEGHILQAEKHIARAKKEVEAAEGLDRHLRKVAQNLEESALTLRLRITGKTSSTYRTDRDGS